MRRRVAVLAVGLLVSAAGIGRVEAQVTTGKTIATDSVDLFSEPPAQGMSRKSPGFAMVQSIVLPGLGQQYLGQRQRAIVYFGTELLLVFGAIFTESYSRHSYDDARTMAWEYAGARGGNGADDQYWQNVGRYLDSQGYNADQELNRTPQNMYVQPNLQWAWVDQEHLDQYDKKRNDASNYHVASSFFIGAMVLDRLISFIDVRISTLRTKRTHTLGLHFQPSVSPDLSTVALTVSRAF